MDIGNLIMKKWTLIFSQARCEGCEIYIIDGDPQKAAMDIIKDNPWVFLIAAVEGTPHVLPMDSARTAECGLHGWPE